MIKDFIKEAAASLGFDACGIARAEELKEDADFLNRWLKAGYHGEMYYMEQNFEKRINPQKLVPGCKTVAVTLLNYYIDCPSPTDAPRIAKYAYSETDYHKVIKQKLRQLENEIKNKFGENCFSKDFQHVFVDSAPILERRWAERAGLGWLGKNTQLIHPGLGSYVFIGILLLNIEVEPDLPISSRCGKCKLCWEACPTKALSENGLDARKCISYLTVEYKKEIPMDFQNRLTGFIAGCDICAEVCPWNKKWAVSHNHDELKLNSHILNWKYENWEHLSSADFEEIFHHSALQRIGFKKLKDNIHFAKKFDALSKNK